MTDTTSYRLDEAALQELLKEHFEIETEHLRPDVTFEELELDSLAVLELMVVVENLTGVELSEEQLGLGPTSTLADAGRILAHAVAEASAGAGRPAEVAVR